MELAPRLRRCGESGLPVVDERVPLHMKRNHAVVLIVVAALILIAWSGVVNHLRRSREARERIATRAVLIPDSAADSFDSASEPMAAESDAPGALDHKPAPRFTLLDLDGRKVSLSDYRGKAVLVNFWATWCGPCKVEIPWFTKLHDQYASQGFEILGISNDQIDEDDKPRMIQEKEEIRTFVSRMQMNYPVLLEGDSVAENYGGVDSLPTSFFIDRNGVVVAETSGLHSRDEIEADIRKALAGGGQ